ncbi:MAG: NACHT domain-containing protein [Trichodesmium sp. ALOHA_ZT_67]|nr:NACHT domain-containing protein [Trichodesmium sp. ALOHA_ZT_67]
MVTQADPNLNISKTGLEADFFILEKRSFKNRPDLLPESSENNLPNEKPFETLYDAFERYKRLVLLGEPGAGKTVALQEFKKNISKKERQAENNSLVIFVSIQKWNYPADIVTFLAKEIGKTEEDFRKEIQTKRLLLLLDGLDELPSNVSKRSESRDAEIIDYRVHFLSKLSDFSRNLNPNNISIVMTCRKRDYEEIRRKIQEEKKDFKNIFHGLVVLNRLKNDEIKTYLKEINQKKLNNSLNGEKIDFDLLWNTIQVKKDLLELIRTPFLLYVLSSTLVSIYQQNPSSIFQGIEAIYKAVSNLEELLDKFVREQYKRESGKSKIPIPWSLNKVKRLLGQIAVLMMSDREPDDNEILPEHFNKVIQNQEDIKKFIDLTKNLYLLESEEKANNQNPTSTYKFRHLTLRDYFAFDYGSNFFDQQEDNFNQKSEKFKLEIEPEQVVKAIGKIEKEQVVKLLTKLLDHPAPDVRYEAIKSLGELRTLVYVEGYNSDLKNQVVNYSLDEFDKSLIKEYFREKKYFEINDNEAEKIYQYSGGNVWIIEQIATMFGVVSLDEILGVDNVPMPIAAKSPDEQILATTVQRLLHYCVNKEDKRAVYLLAIAYSPTIAYSPNPEFLKFMLGCENLDAKLQELHNNYPFILPEKQQLEGIHQKFTKQYLLSLRNENNFNKYESESQKIAKNLNRKAAHYFQDKIEDLTGKLTTAKQRFRNEEFPDFIINWFYHRFWLSSKDNVEYIWNDMIPYLVEGWHYNNNFVIKLLEIAGDFDKDYEFFQLFKAVFMEGKDRYSLVKKLVDKLDKTRKKDEWVAIVLLIYCDFLYEEKKYSEVLKRWEQAQIFIPEEAEDLRRSFEKLWSLSFKQEKKNDFKEDQIETESSPPIDLSKNIDLGKVSSDILSRLEKLENQRNTFSQQATQKEEKTELQLKQNYHPNEEKIEEDKEQKFNSQTWSEKQANIPKKEKTESQLKQNYHPNEEKIEEDKEQKFNSQTWSEKQANILKSDNEKLIYQLKFWHLIVLIFPLYIIILVFFFLVYLIYEQNNMPEKIQPKNEQNNMPEKIQTRNEQNNMPEKIQPKNEQEYKKINKQENENLIE